MTLRPSNLCMVTKFSPVNIFLKFLTVVACIAIDWWVSLSIFQVDFSEGHAQMYQRLCYTRVN